MIMKKTDFTKRLSRLATIVALAFGSLVFVSACDKFGDPKDTDGDGNEFVNDSFTEQGNKLIYKRTVDYGYYAYKEVWTFEFNNDDECISAKLVCTFDNATLADAFYQAYEGETDTPATKSGKNVTVNYTSIYRGMARADIRSALELMDQAY